MPKLFWTPERDALLGTGTDKAIAAQVGTTRDAVRSRRTLLGIEPYAPNLKREWTRSEIKLLGKYADSVVAQRIGVSRLTVLKKRKELGIEPAYPELASNKNQGCQPTT